MSRLTRLLLTALAVGILAEAARAAILSGTPFAFQFATPFLTQLFLAPFLLAGCG